MNLKKSLFLSIISVSFGNMREMLMWFKNARFYTVDFSELADIFRDEKLLCDAVESTAFRPCTAQEVSTIGFVPVFGGETPYHFSCGHNHFFKLQEETKLLPASVVNNQLNELIASKELELKRQLRKNERDALKSAVINQLLSRAFATRRDLIIWCNPEAKLCAISASSAKRAEKALAMMREAFSTFPAKLLEPHCLVEDRLTSWIREGKSAPLFALGNDTTLKSVDDDGGTIKISREDLTSEEIGVHVDAGKVVTELQLSFDDSLILVLSSDLSCKRMKPTDLYLERNLPPKSDDAIADLQAHMVLQGEMLEKLGTYILETFDCAQKA